MVTRRFRPDTSSSNDRLRLAMERARQMASQRQSARPAPAGGGALADRMAQMRGGQAAVDFGRSMAGLDQGGTQGQIDAIRAQVAQRLAQKGIYQDQGGYHIQGLQQPPDIGIAMRDAAVQAMGGDPWTKIVQEADARLRAGNLPIPTTAGVNGPTPYPGLGGVPSVSGGTTRTVTPPTITGGRPSTGPVPQPGLGGVPPVRPATPAPASGGVPQPGLGGVPQSPGRPSNVTPFPPQGQGVGRTTTPTGNQISPGQYPTTAPQPGLGGTMGIPPGGAPQPGLGGTMGIPAGNGSTTIYAGNGTTPLPANAGVPQPGLGGVPLANPGGHLPPDVYPTQTGQFPPQGQGVGRTTTPTGNQVSPTQYPVTTPAGGMPGNAPGGGIAPRPAPATPSGTPVSPGRVTTPVVNPGSMPGQSTPSRPGMPSTFPNGGVFGTPGSTPIPQISTGGMPGQPTGNLANLAQEIIARTQGRVNGAQVSTNAAGTGTVNLAGLGDRIRAQVQGNLGQAGLGAPGAPSAPSIPGVNLSGLGNSIMDRVRQQLAQAQVGQLGTMPQGGPATAPSTTGGMPPVTTPGGQPAPASPMPQGTGQLSAMGGKYAPLDQYNAAFEAAGKEFGVPPELLKAMAGIESGWTGDPSVCRGDDGTGGGPSCGIMQVKGDLHQEAGCTNQNDPVCNIRTAAAILKGGYDACGNWDCAITSVYFTQDDVNGTTQGDYLNAVHQSMQEQAANPGAPTTAPSGTVIGQGPGGQVIGQGGVQPAQNPATASMPQTTPSGPTADPSLAPGGTPLPPGSPPQPAGTDRNGVAAPPGSFTLPPAGQTIQMPDATSQQIVDIAQLYVNQVPYENVDEWNLTNQQMGWGNPGKGIDPRGTPYGWDCSGMVYWLDQNYGNGTLVQGSHQQYNQLQAAGYFNDNRAAAVNAGDYSSLRPGDLIYMATGENAQGNDASHVAIFAGLDSDGQPLYISAANDTEGTTIWHGTHYQILGVATYWT